MKMKLRGYLILVFMLCSICLPAQSENFITITGTIADSQTKDRLGLASIGISNQALGTISNTLGEFMLRVPEQFFNDTLIVTYLGYKKYTHAISRINNNSRLQVELTPESTMLQEISVYANKLTAEQVIEKAVYAIKENYPTDAFLVEGFFRDILKENEKYVELTEAALKVFDKHFQRKLNHGITEEVIISEARKSINYANPLIQRVRKQNGIMDLLDDNPVHYTRGLLNTKYFDYEMDSSIETNDGLVYIISTIPAQHRIYVLASNYAIIKTVQELKENDTFFKRPEFSLNDSLVVRRMVYFQAISEFQKYHGKMYLKYSNETDAYEVLHKISRKRKFLVEAFKEFVVTNIIDEDVRPFNKKEKYNFRDGVANKNYHPAFWENFSTIQLSPLNYQVKKDLERDFSLEDQFAKVK